MTCLPESGGCERPTSDALISEINEKEGTSFRHVVCLDVTIRDRAQPEALYRDELTGAELVVEHKTVVWPLDYVQRHKADHSIFQSLCRALADVTEDHPYTLILQPLFQGDKRALTKFVDEVAATIHQNIDQVRGGRRIESTTCGHRWIFRVETEDEREEDEPETGLRVTWPLQPSLFPKPEVLPALRSQVEKHFAACGNKFAEYDHARRVLVLLPQGDLEWSLRLVWNDLMSTMVIPSCIDEIWLGASGFEDGIGLLWHWARLHPVRPDDTPKVRVHAQRVPHRPGGGE
jgi:hypothetical protein